MGDGFKLKSKLRNNNKELRMLKIPILTLQKANSNRKLQVRPLTKHAVLYNVNRKVRIFCAHSHCNKL